MVISTQGRCAAVSQPSVVGCFLLRQCRSVKIEKNCHCSNLCMCILVHDTINYSTPYYLKKTFSLAISAATTPLQAAICDVVQSSPLPLAKHILLYMVVAHIPEQQLAQKKHGHPRTHSAAPCSGRSVQLPRSIIADFISLPAAPRSGRCARPVKAVSPFSFTPCSPAQQPLR